MKTDNLYNHPDIYHRSYSSTFGRLALSRVGLSNSISDGDSVLCVGAGTGVVASWIEEYTHAEVVYSLEPHPMMREKCQSVTTGPVIGGVIESIPLQEDTVDVTVCVGGVLSYAKSIDDAIEEVVRVTKETGEIGLSGFQSGFPVETESKRLSSEESVDIKWETNEDGSTADVSFTYTNETNDENDLVGVTTVSLLDKDTILSRCSHSDVSEVSLESDRTLIWGIHLIV
jgi:ubiquinone/menaquinone biosynthesis C-methylase UbiE